MKLAPQIQLKAKPQLPGDKSISHRCLILSSLAHGKSILKNVSHAQDVLSTQNVLKNLGVEITKQNDELVIFGNGLFLKEPSRPLNCGNAGTLMRLMMGVLAGQNFNSVMVGDESLMSRPMDRVSNPLNSLGANIQLSKNQAPVHILKASLKGGSFELMIPSAQVKSALMLAGFYSDQPVTLTGALKSRDHTERLLQMYGVEIQKTENSITVQPHPRLRAVEFQIPCDPSAAAFWMGASLLSRQTCTLENVSLNPSRLGFLKVFEDLGIPMAVTQTASHPEPVGHILIKPKDFKGFEISQEMLPSLIDEVPLLCLLATQGSTESVIYGAGELRFKETDRIVATSEMFHSLGLKLNIEGDTLFIPGNQIIQGGTVNSYKDHRIAMTAAIASFRSESDIEIVDSECASISDPHFWGNFI